MKRKPAKVRDTVHWNQRRLINGHEACFSCSGKVIEVINKDGCHPKYIVEVSKQVFVHHEKVTKIEQTHKNKWAE